MATALHKQGFSLVLDVVVMCAFLTSLISDSDVDILPSTYSTTLYFSIEEMQALKGSPAFGKKI